MNDNEKKVKEISRIKKAEPVKPVERVSKIESVSRVRQPTLALSAKERQKLLKLLEEEANELVKNGLIPEKDKDVVTKAVEYALTSSFIDDDSDVE